MTTSRPRAGLRSLRGRRCFITGAASGIGRATAMAAGRQGAELFLTDLDRGKLELAAGAIRDVGGRVVELEALDVSDVAAVRALADRIHAAHGSMDVVMNVAGVSIWGTVEALQHEHWRRCVDVNLMGPIHVIESFVPAMIAAGRGGHLVNVSSAAGLFGLPWHAAYSASKFGLRGLSEVLRFDLERHGIGVSLVCPGAVKTPLVDTVEIVGVDTARPAVRELRARFERHAVSADEAARAILRGIARNEPLVYTSLDIRVGHWFQRVVPSSYERVMRWMNDRFDRAARDPAPPSHDRGPW